MSLLKNAMLSALLAAMGSVAAAEKITGGEAECTAKTDGVTVETAKILVNKTYVFEKLPGIQLDVNNYEGTLYIQPFDKQTGEEGDIGSLWLADVNKPVTQNINKRISLICKLLSKAVVVTPQVGSRATSQSAQTNHIAAGQQ